MKVSLEVSFLLCRMGLTSSDESDYISKQEVLQHLEDRKEDLKDTIENSDYPDRVKRAKKSLESKKQAIKDVKEIDDWQSFQEKIYEGDYRLSNSNTKVKNLVGGMG